MNGGLPFVLLLLAPAVLPAVFPSVPGHTTPWMAGSRRTASIS